MFTAPLVTLALACLCSAAAGYSDAAIAGALTHFYLLFIYV